MPITVGCQQVNKLWHNNRSKFGQHTCSLRFDYKRNGSLIAVNRVHNSDKQKGIKVTIKFQSLKMLS